MVVPFLDFLKKELSLKVSLGYTSEDFNDVLELLSQGELNGHMNEDELTVGHQEE